MSLVDPGSGQECFCSLTLQQFFPSTFICVLFLLHHAMLRLSPESKRSLLEQALKHKPANGLESGRFQALLVSFLNQRQDIFPF